MHSMVVSNRPTSGLLISQAPDFFPTPSWATFAFIDNEKFAGDIWERACGDGAMSRVLEETGRRVFGSDLHQRGYGESGRDFLTWERKATNVVTNPPYNSADGFVAAGIRKAWHKFALLLRVAFLEGATGPIQSLSRHRPRACGSSVSGSRFILVVLPDEGPSHAATHHRHPKVRTLNDMPRQASSHLYFATCLVGMGEIDKARAAFARGQRLAPEYFRTRLEGTSVYARPEDRIRQQTFVHIALALKTRVRPTRCADPLVASRDRT